MKEKWKKIFSKNHKLMYAGYVVDDKPFGTGISYYENGNKCQEGVFDDKCLIHGKEYYQNGNLRFEGVYTHNEGYGHNYPTYGTCYDEDGNEIFYGELKIRKIGSVGFPKIIKPKEYGSIPPKGRPDFVNRSWVEEHNEPCGTYYVNVKGGERIERIEFLERNGFKCENDDVTTRESTLASRFPVKICFDHKTYRHIHTTTSSAAVEASRRTLPVDEFMFVFECEFELVIV